MANSSLVILNGVHNIYQRILTKLPENLQADRTTKSLSADIRISGSVLLAEVSTEGKLASVPIALLIDLDSFVWVPHPSLVHDSEVIAITEMLSEFEKSQLQHGPSRAERTQALQKSCESFFRSVYR